MQKRIGASSRQNCKPEQTRFHILLFSLFLIHICCYCEYSIAFSLSITSSLFYTQLKCEGVYICVHILLYCRIGTKAYGRSSFLLVANYWWAPKDSVPFAYPRNLLIWTDYEQCKTEDTSQKNRSFGGSWKVLQHYSQNKAATTGICPTSTFYFILLNCWKIISGLMDIFVGFSLKLMELNTRITKIFMQQSCLIWTVLIFKHGTPSGIKQQFELKYSSARFIFIWWMIAQIYFHFFCPGDSLNVWKATFLQYSEKLSETVKKQPTVTWVTYPGDAIIFKQL